MSSTRLAGHKPLPRNRPLRILIGPKEIGGQIPDYAAGFRALGHQVTTVIREHNPMFRELEYDVDLSKNREPGLIARLIDEHDVFVFQFGETLVPGSVDLPVIRDAGKSIIAICNGDDIRHSSAYHQEFGVPPEVHGEFYVKDPLPRPMQTMRLMERYASLVVSVPNQSGLALRPYMHFAYVIDLSLYTEKIPDREIPVVVHAPSDRACKGTREILESLDRLATRGIKFELRLLEKVPNAVVRETLRDADVAIDQLFVSYGKFAAEALASGCATACITYPDIEPFAHFRPLHHIDAANIDSQLERLLTDRSLRRSLAERGRPHVEAVHDRTVVCKRLIDSLSAALDGSLRYDYYPTFFAERYTLPQQVELPRHQRLLASEVIAEHGMPAGTDTRLLARRGLIDTLMLSGSGPVVTWNASRGLTSDGFESAAMLARFKAFRRPPVRNTDDVVAAAVQDSVLARYFGKVNVAGAFSDSATITSGVADYLRLGLPSLALQTVLPLAMQSPAARRAAGLLLLGSGQFADAEEMLGTFLVEADADPIVAYYHSVARVLQGKAEGTVEAMHAAIRRMPRSPELMLFGSTPILHNRYWVEALREGGDDARTLMIEYYGAINRREDFDHYTLDFVPEWTEPRCARLLAPYHAFLFTTLFGKVLHTSFDGGALQDSACAPIEPSLLQAAGVKSVVLTYGGDGAMYSRIRDLSVRHAFQLSYPDAARKEPLVEAKVARWTRDADRIVGNIHSLDGHGRWDVLVGNAAQIDLKRIAPIAAYSDRDGRNGAVRVLHTPNHRGVKGSEFLIAAIEQLRKEGLQIELVLLERVQNSEVLETMRTVDILAEQFVLQFYGLSGIEGLATGLPVIANLSMDDYLQVLRRFSYLDECPIVAASVEMLTDVLRRLVTDPALRASLGRAGRQYAEKYHSYSMTRHLFGAIHRSLEGDKSVDLMNLFHPLRSEYVRHNPIVHPLQSSRLPAERQRSANLIIDSASSAAA